MSLGEGEGREAKVHTWESPSYKGILMGINRGSNTRHGAGVHKGGRGGNDGK